MLRFHVKHSFNLCATVEARGPRFETLPCTVVRMQKPPYSDRVNRYHEWTDHAGGLQGGRCIHCGRLLREVRQRVGYVPRSRLAREIANTPRDVPPVRFVGRL